MSPIEFFRRAFLVRRYHQYFTQEVDTVGKHSAGVAVFVHLINPNASKELIMACLTHDMGEVILGDIPAPTKRALSSSAKMEIDRVEESALSSMGFHFVSALTEEEAKLMKVADCLDGLSFCIEERRRGNLSIKPVGDNYALYLSEISGKLPEASWRLRALEVIDQTTQEWRNCNVR